jgi:hypothetical protein
VRPQVFFVRGVWAGYRRSANGSLMPSTILHNDAYPHIACPSSPFNPRGRLKQRRREMTRREPPRRSNARGAGPDYHDIHVSGHLLHT